MAAVASRSSNSSPHLSTMSSPKRTLPLKHEDNQRKSSPLLRSKEARRPSPPAQEAPAAESSTAETKPATTSTTTAAPLAPPPRPTADAPDYFNQSHGSTHILSTEANPFEHAFGASSVDTPGKSLLPSVAALTSPSQFPGGTPGWGGSLRSGPLSPAMLTGPTAQSDYFDNFRGSFPTPNESSMRTGLTPGGGGSMFPAPSPNSQALFQQLQSGGATPSTLDFHRTALSAAAQAKANAFTATHNPPAVSAQTSEPAMPAVDSKPPQGVPAVQPQADPFGQHDADAANSLFLLTQANGNRANGQYQQSHTHHMPNHMGSQSQETSPTTKRALKNSVTSMPGSADTGDYSDSQDEARTKPATRSRGNKKGGATNGGNNARRKASETPAKAPVSKKSKGNNGAAQMMMDEPESEEEEPTSPLNENGKKMTDEEKRKNFLERNRVAALKCRQRKKQWLANLQAKVEIFSAENDQLSASVTQLREEIVNLKTLLLAHKDCPVSSQQGLQGPNMVAFVNGGSQQVVDQAPYGMGMPPPNGMMMQVGGHPGMQRR